MKLMQITFTAMMAQMVSTTIATKHGVDDGAGIKDRFRKSTTNMHQKKHASRRLGKKVGKNSKSSKSSDSLKLTKTSASQFTVSYYDNMSCGDGSDNWDHLPICGLFNLQPYFREFISNKTIAFPPATDPEVTFLGSGRSEHVAARFDGKVKFPQVGLYRARLGCNDGCRVWMFDDSEWKLIINNDDRNQDIGASFYISDPGLKGLEIEYYNKSGSSSLTLEIAAPDAPAVPIVFE